VPLGHPAFLAAAVVAFVCILVSASYVLYDTDLWTLLVGGKAIWALGEIPKVDLWTWRHHGEPRVLSSWGFRALLWPIWSVGDIAGLYALRWITTLAVFGLVWATARALGARGMRTLLVLVWCALVYRLRTDIRPEIGAAVLLACELWILEVRRRGIAEGRAFRGDPAWWVVPIAWAWANLHVSYWVGLLVLGFYLVDSMGPRRAAAASGLRTLALVMVAAAVISFLNPFGWRALWQPFEFLLFWRNDPMFRTIGELQPLPWREHLRSGLPLLLIAWPASMLLRMGRRQVDRVEWLACAFFTTAVLTSQRFTAMYAVAAAPFVARGLAEPTPGWAARWVKGAWPRAAVVSALSVLISLPEWLRPELPLGIGIVPNAMPAAACDFMERAGIRGRAFNEMELGGYLAYRFWPERDRLPFISTQPENAAPEDRRLYVASYTDPEASRELDRRHRFDYAFLGREQSPGSRLLDILDQDTSWVMVFTDDIAEILVKRHGPLGGVAARWGYRELPAGPQERSDLVARCARDAALRSEVISEVASRLGDSPWNGGAHHLLGVLMLMERRRAEARAHLEQALALKPSLPRVHELLGQIALDEGRPADAARLFEGEGRLHGGTPGLEFQLGNAYARTGDARRAAAAYRRALELDPSHPGARDSLAVRQGP
jgi:tetratricopeptide (TPR) repeat protein